MRLPKSHEVRGDNGGYDTCLCIVDPFVIAHYILVDAPPVTAVAVRRSCICLCGGHCMPPTVH